MHPDLEEVIKTAKQVRSKLIEGKMDIGQANAVVKQNQMIVAAFALDLRERMFLAGDDDNIARIGKPGGGTGKLARIGN